MNRVIRKFKELYGVTRPVSTEIRDIIEETLQEYDQNGFNGTLSNIDDTRERAVIKYLHLIYRDIRLYKDVLILIALNLNLKDIDNLCLTNSEYRRWICGNRDFWYQKLKQDFFFLEPASNNFETLYRQTDKQYSDEDYLNELLIEKAGEGDLRWVKFLTKRGADPTFQGQTAFGTAIGNGHLEVIKYFLDNYDLEISWQDSWFGRKQGHEEVAKLLDAYL